MQERRSVIAISGEPTVSITTDGESYARSLKEAETVVMNFQADMTKDQFDRLKAVARYNHYVSLHQDTRTKRQRAHRNGPCPCGSGRKYKRCCR